ncbi:MAG: sensory transduction histidine kinase [Promethearchaeota archaeon CR_4]|nr:MAG: sensory transduction histidine kinase [Candidatus Lokiarchaeota archaeon CR_4]
MDDISERKQTEKGLLENAERFHDLINSLPQVIYETDALGTFSFVNDSVFQVFGFTRDDITGITNIEQLIESEDRVEIKEHMIQMMQSGEAGSFEYTAIRKDGNTFPIQIYAAPIIKGKNAGGIRGIISDISKQKKSEIALKELLEKSLQISEMKSNLITFASHELKTPLVPIMGWSELIENSLKKGKSLDKMINLGDIESITRSAKKLSKIIDNFLDVGRIQSNRMELHKNEQSTADLMERAIESVTPLAKTFNITIHNDLQNQSLYIDGFRIEEVFTNILSNAIKYSPPKSNVWITSERLEGIYIVSIRDQGEGFTSEQLQDVWHPFSTSYLVKSDSPFPGTGVGLYLSKSIVELHDGKIEISSAGRKQGSTIKITLPSTHPRPTEGYWFKLIILGEGSVGKSSLVRNFSEKHFDDDYLPTLGANVLVKEMNLVFNREKVKVSLAIWDIAGQEEFRLIAPAYHAGAAGAFLVGDLTRLSSFNALSAWRHELSKDLNKDIPIILLANKCDLSHQIEGLYLEKLASQLGAFNVFKTSALTGENVQLAFQLIAEKMLENSQNQEKSK